MPDPDLVRFGRNLASARKKRGVSQMDLARGIPKMHPTSIARYETAQRNPSLLTILKLARALDVPPSDLLDGL